MESELKLINSMIFNAIKHGADAGGSYKQNMKALTQSMMDYLK